MALVQPSTVTLASSLARDMEPLIDKVKPTTMVRKPRVR